MDAIKIIGKRAEGELNNLAMLDVCNEQIETILNQRVENILQNIVGVKHKDLDWEKTVDDNIKSEELVLKYKALVNKNIMINRQLVYKYGLYDVMHLFKLSEEK